MDNQEPRKVVVSPMIHEHEKRELRIIKQAIAKSFITSGKIDLKLTEETKEQMEEWIKWIYRDEEKDWRLVKEKEHPF